ncbi:MAG: pyridoxamine 5'-phosphate oxidase family protein [Clostridiales Family XIII bacterium]|jgi:nitroimidazol reductase NimA-like FMN-containing flavoprotein (pyridoxamine 5'-phosphate oxidase superfamily)|nr:pyridoxamine 5'-phosphate oxidase family protein [Clostridiales Family XIII bacterium]
MRRKDYEQDRAFALAVLDKCEYAFLAMIDPSGGPYGVALNVVRDGDFVYLHCAKDGFKLDCLRANPSVCLFAVGETQVLTKRFTTNYESAMVRGTAEEVTDADEAVRALKLLSEKFSPGIMHHFAPHMEKVGPRTAVWRVRIDEITGKKKETEDVSQHA